MDASPCRYLGRSRSNILRGSSARAVPSVRKPRFHRPTWVRILELADPDDVTYVFDHGVEALHDCVAVLRRERQPEQVERKKIVFWGVGWTAERMCLRAENLCNGGVVR